MFLPSNVNTAITTMDHLAMQCKEKLETLRIKELKDVLSIIGAGKQGKKQVLVDKIMAIVLAAETCIPTGLKLESFSARNSRSREDVAKIIDDVYRVRRFGAPDLATVIDNGIGDGLFGYAPHTIANGVPSAANSKTGCPCGNVMEFGTMIQCEAPSCLARQHVNCVIVAESEDMKPKFPSKFFCEVCRIQHGDPFCVSVTHPLMPSKTIPSFVYSPEGGTSLMQKLEASFTLTYNDWELLRNPDYDLQVWCVLLCDEVPFRMHWPLKADLRVNGDFVRVTNRPGQQKLGLNGRDDGPVITGHMREGINMISLTAHDGRSFCLGVRIIRRLTVKEVLSLIPNEAEGESLDVALARVWRCISGGGAVGDDSDSDLEVVSEWVTVNLRCPMSGSRIRVAGRFKPCTHLGCFDLHIFVELNQRARKWQCPSCLTNYCLRDLVIDPFFTQVARALESYDEDVSEVEMKPDGCWRPKLDGDSKTNESWRSPVGLIATANGSNKTYSVLTSVKVEEGVSFEKVPSLKIGFKRTQDGIWKVNGASGLADLTTSNMMLGDNFEVIKNRSRSHSSTATASKEVSSVNQDPMQFLKQFGREEVEVNSFPFSAPVNAYSDSFCGGVPDQGLTALINLVSDDEDNAAAEGACPPYTRNLEAQDVDGRNIQRVVRQGYSEAEFPLAEVGSLQPSITALDLLGLGGGRPSTFPAQKEMWQTEKQAGSFDFLERCSNGTQGYNPCVSLNRASRETNALEMTCANPSGETRSSCGHRRQTVGDEKSTELPAPDSSFREFLPHQPARSTSVVSGHDEPREAFPDDMQDGWFSLSLGGNESLNSAYELSGQATQMSPLVESASLLLDLSHYNTGVDGSSFGSERTKGSTIIPPAQYESNYFSIDSDSD